MSFATSWFSRSSRPTTRCRAARMTDPSASARLRRTRRGPEREGRPERLPIDVVAAGVRVPGLAEWVRRVAPVRARGHLTIAIVPDAQVRALNRRFRRKDRPTDVLSFPSGEGNHLGDV